MPLYVPGALIYRVGPQPGEPVYVPDVLNNREGPQARSKCLNGLSYGERLAKKTLWSPATAGWKKDSDKGRTPVAEAVCVPAHLTPPGSPHGKQLRHLHAQHSLGHGCHRQKKSCVCVCRVTLVVSNSLWPCRLWPSRLLCQGSSAGKNTRAYWPILVAIPY